ncbi:MAG: XkdQ/YqbQ family protein, partial [Candidatus Methanospirareceae archaeon]
MTLTLEVYDSSSGTWIDKTSSCVRLVRRLRSEGLEELDGELVKDVVSVGQEIRLKEDDQIVFEGIVYEVSRSHRSKDVERCRFKAYDYLILYDRYPVYRLYQSGTTAGEIIRDLASLVDGVDVSNVDDGDQLLAPWAIENEKALDIMRSVARGTNYWLRMKPGKKLYFKPKTIFQHFQDDFETWEGWIQYGNGVVSQSNEEAYEGSYSLKKDAYGDPNGGYKELGAVLSQPFKLEVWVKRTYLSGANYDRIGVIDEDGNGYGFIVDHGGNRVGLERRDSYTGVSSSQVWASLTKSVTYDWYRAVFIWKNGWMKVEIYDQSGEKVGEVETTDYIYSRFTRVYVFGGYTYYVDALKIVPLTEINESIVLNAEYSEDRWRLKNRVIYIGANNQVLADVSEGDGDLPVIVHDPYLTDPREAERRAKIRLALNRQFGRSLRITMHQSDFKALGIDLGDACTINLPTVSLDGEGLVLIEIEYDPDNLLYRLTFGGRKELLEDWLDEQIGGDVAARFGKTMTLPEQTSTLAYTLDKATKIQADQKHVIYMNKPPLTLYNA